MKKIILILVCISSLATMVQAQQQDSREPSHPGKVYGADVKEKGAKDAVALPEMLEKHHGKMQAKVKGKVVDVCPKKGCWMNVAVNDSTNIFVKMKDYAFFVPMDLIGKTIVMDGTAYEEVTSVEELRHYAEDAKKPQETIDAITTPEKSIRFTANGIKVLE